MQSLCSCLTPSVAGAGETKLCAEFTRSCMCGSNIIHSLNWQHHHGVKPTSHSGSVTHSDNLSVILVAV